MTPEEQETIQEELDYHSYWNDDGVIARLDAELQYYMRIYAGIEQEESPWMHQLSMAKAAPLNVH